MSRSSVVTYKCDKCGATSTDKKFLTDVSANVTVGAKRIMKDAEYCATCVAAFNTATASVEAAFPAEVKK